VFCYLNKLEPQETPRTPIGKSLPEYKSNLPVNHYMYEEAMLHMKRERGETLDVVVKEYENKIKEINMSNYLKSQRIYEIIEKNFSGYKIESIEYKKQIIDKVDQLLIEMQSAIDVHIWAETSPEPDIHGLDQKAIQCLRAIVKDPEVLDLMYKVKGERIQLNSSIHKVQDKSYWISKTIQSQDYDVVADCCPNFWKSLYSTFFKFPRLRRSK
jgi:hypothetical protein